MEDIEGIVRRMKRTIDMSAVGVRLAVEKLKEAPGGCRHVEMSEAMQQELRTQSI